MVSRLISQAKKNLRDYKIIDRWMAGLELTGNEIKSIRNNRVAIDEAYALPQQKELYVFNMNIAAYQYSHARNLAQARDTRRKRKLLLTRREINKIIGVMKAKNYVLVPLQLFINNKGWAKLEIALAQRLRKYQIKEKIKEKEMKRKLREGDF
ncbi:SsrA-binding protein [endosymbiont DhMRE of Dentiscutata heterogama]|uniref:SsrA-binding protein n=1 Tax=endosymbiont DhMRE of Dentiscutata heterogama TaxID=1609546 RepID=UPI000629D483|nr:SsrA-binding protein [endosymbiont DhMRE of Dentiscutata heterogama]CFW92888.1 SsrA-binding protein [endosymbiont DhMRE of Dentiscutata heterogama]